MASIEVEKALDAADSAIRDAAVIGLSYERRSDADTAVFAVKKGNRIDENERFCRLREHLSPFKRRKGILTSDAMPKTATEKAPKRMLRANCHS